MAIASALATRPKLLIADEPTTALDVTVQAGILRLLDRLRRELGLSVILITHDLGVLSSIADHVSIFYAGRIVESGPTERAARPAAASVYARSARRAPASRSRGPGGAPGNSGTAAEPAQPPVGLRLPSALCLRAPGVQGERAAVRARLEDAASGVPSRSLLGSGMSLLAIHELDVVYRRHGEDIRAVASASLSVDRGQIVGLVGESGCGKSSLARAAVGLVTPAAGEIVFDGKPLLPLRRGARPRSATRLQMVFQNPYSSLNPRRTIGSQVADGLRLAGESERLVRRRRVAELLDKVGLASTATSRFPHQFSGGQRQRVAIARALAANPSVIVLDEPLSSLDASAQAQIANLLVGLARDLDLALLLISHDLAIVRHIADTVFVMYLGEIVERGPTRAVWTKPSHPYTEALVAAIPRADGSGTLPEALPGEVPDPARPPSGCRFHPRCPYVFERCPTEVPPLYDLGA